jgi:hypothetical protein
MVRLGGQVKPGIRFHIILLHAASQLIAEAHYVLGFGIALPGLGFAFSEFLASCIGFRGLAAREDQASRAEERGEQSGGVGGPELGRCSHLRAIDRIDQESREGVPRCNSNLVHKIKRFEQLRRVIHRVRRVLVPPRGLQDLSPKTPLTPCPDSPMYDKRRCWHARCGRIRRQHHARHRGTPIVFETGKQM